MNPGRSARQAVQRQHPVRHFIIAADDTGKVRIGRAFLTMHRILDKENRIQTDMALALPVAVKDAVAVWHEKCRLKSLSDGIPSLRQ
ncbi:hypothetical protein [Neisseria lactamica]|uniref:hypothetical protein n=1 Tax=Neisseria lactamica TaxID=486 RepID=UPI000E58E8FC|nr:hypothetical protein [Neisseria lactamica]